MFFCLIRSDTQMSSSSTLHTYKRILLQNKLQLSSTFKKRTIYNACVCTHICSLSIRSSLASIQEHLESKLAVHCLPLKYKYSISALSSERGEQQNGWIDRSTEINNCWIEERHTHTRAHISDIALVVNTS